MRYVSVFAPVLSLLAAAASAQSVRTGEEVVGLHAGWPCYYSDGGQWYDCPTGVSGGMCSISSTRCARSFSSRRALILSARPRARPKPAANNWQTGLRRLKPERGRSDPCSGRGAQPLASRILSAASFE